MNKLTILKAGVVVLATSFITPNAISADYQFIAGDKSVTTKLCVAAVSNNLMATKRYIRGIGVQSFDQSAQVKLALNAVTCNGQNMLEFTANYNADKTFNYLNKRASKKHRIHDKDVRIIDIAKQSKSDEVIVLVVTSR